MDKKLHPQYVWIELRVGTHYHKVNCQPACLAHGSYIPVDKAIINKYHTSSRKRFEPCPACYPKEVDKND